MTLDDAIPLVLALVAMAASTGLIVYRLRLNGLHSNTRRRYLFMDMLILIAAVEMLIDSLADVGDVGDPFRLAATLTRGAVTCGVIALLISFPQYKRDATQHRRHDDA